jgi:hypothetical protein
MQLDEEECGVNRRGAGRCVLAAAQMNIVAESLTQRLDGSGEQQGDVKGRSGTNREEERWAASRKKKPFQEKGPTTPSVFAIADFHVTFATLNQQEDQTKVDRISLSAVEKHPARPKISKVELRWHRPTCVTYTALRFSHYTAWTGLRE